MPARSGDVVILSMAINQDDLWDEHASLEEVPKKERDETLKEVLTEIGNKMKRRHKLKELMTFEVKKMQ